VKGKTLFEMSELDSSLEYICEYYLNIADQIIGQPEGVIPKEAADRELFRLLSDFYLTGNKTTHSEVEETKESENVELILI